MDKVEVRAVITYFCNKGISAKETRGDFIKILEDESFLQNGEEMGC